MIRDTIKDYLGRMVQIETVDEVGINEKQERGDVYVGRVSNYDSDFITLNPYQRVDGPGFTIRGNRWRDVERLFKEGIGKLKAGEAIRQITLGRRTIKTIEEIVKPQ